MIPEKQIKTICERGRSDEILALIGRLLHSRDQRELGRTLFRNLENFFYESVSKDHAAIALALEAEFGRQLLFYNETEEGYRGIFGKYGEVMARLGQRLYPGKPATGENIAFLMHTSPWLAHTALTIEMASYGNNACIVFMDRPDERSGPTLQKCRERGIPVSYVKDKDLKQDQMPGWVRDTLTERRCGTVIWVSTCPMVSYVFGARVAENQIHWGMRFHPFINSPFVDFNIGWSSSLPNSAKYRYVEPINPVYLPNPERAWEAPRETGLFIFGSMARQEKMSPEYMSAVTAILDKCPNAQFHFCGNRAGLHPVVEDALRSYDGRVKYLGWAQPERIYDFDCFLETFPLGSSMSLALYKNHWPCVSMRTPYSPISRGDIGGYETVEKYVQAAVDVYRGQYQKMLADNFAFFTWERKQDAKRAATFYATISR